MSDGFQDFGRLWRCADVKDGQVCLYRTGVMVEFVAERFAAGESITSLAKDYGREELDIEAAVRLVVASAFSRRGLLAKVAIAMHSRIPLLPARYRQFAAKPSGGPQEQA